MWNWIKKYFDYRSKYHALLNERNEAIKQAIDIMARYDFLCATLPKGHELSTERNWQAFANNRLRSENFNLNKKLEAITEAHNSMAYLWQENLYKYGVEMYGKWQPMELAPKTGAMILAYAPEDDEYHNIGIMIWCGKDEWIMAGTENGPTGPEKWFSVTLGKEINPTHWMPLPRVPETEKLR